MEELLDYLFQDQESGEVFFVECTSVEEAKKIAFENFDEPELIGIYSVEDAEELGYDTF